MSLFIALGGLTAPAAGQPATDGARLDAPIRGFVYLEPYEIRAEYVLRLDRFPALRAAAGDAAILGAAGQAAVLAAARTRLAGASTITADGVLAVVGPQTVRFIQFEADGGPVLDERDAIPVAEAIVAAVFAGDRSGFPEQLSVTWSMFPPGDETPVPVELEASGPDEAHATTMSLTRTVPAAAWDVPPISMLPPPQAVPAPPADATLVPILVGIAFGIGAIGLAIAAATRPRGQRRGPAFVAVVMAGLGVAAAVGLAGGGARLEREAAREVVGAVLGNVYRAFAHRDESVIFDTLALSVEGPLLEELYLDIRRSFEIEEAGGPRVKVLDLALIDCQVQGASGAGVRARAIWACSGTVSHWGHVHQRRNQYRGELTLVPVDGAWKLVDVTILEEQRI